MTEQQPTGSQPVPVCYRHPRRETYVRCTRCDRPICPDCMHEASVGFQCPECVGAAVKTSRQPRTAFGGVLGGDRGVVTITLIAVNVVVFVLGLLSGGLGAALGGSSLLVGKLTSVQTQFGVIPGAIAYQHEYWRLVTGMFVHLSLMHVAVNMWSLWILGRYLERSLGRLRFLALYLVCGIGGNVAVYLFGASNTLAAGASTAVFGLFAVLFLVNRKMGVSTSGVVVLIVINLAITFLWPGISIAGHIGGLLTGVVCGLGLAYAPRHSRAPVQFAVLGGVFLILVLLTVARTSSLMV